MIVLKKECQTIGFDRWVKANLTDVSSEASGAFIGNYKDGKVAVYQADIHEVILIPFFVTTDLGNGAGAMISISI